MKDRTSITGGADFERRSRRRRCGEPKSIDHHQPGFEPLEPRVLLSAVFTVINTADAGPGSLRQAMLDANAAAEDAVIRFQIPTTDAGFIDSDASIAGGDAQPDVFRIAPLTMLPTLINPSGVVVDGRSQFELTGDTNALGPEVVLDGSLAGVEVDGITFTTANNAVIALNVHSFSRDGVVFLGGGASRVQGNYIGTDPTGTLRRPNRLGVYLVGSPDNLIGGLNADDGNVISGNRLQGIQIRDAGSTGNFIQGNKLGTNPAGTAAVFNQQGVALLYGASNNLVGGETAAARNLISGHTVEGILVAGNTTLGFPIGNRIEGNFIGTNALGTAKLPGPTQTGIHVLFGANDTIIRGTAAAPQVISGVETGISIFLADGAIIEGNLIGTDVTGAVMIGNGGRGITIQDSNHTRVGGGTAQTRNVISGNDAHGISIQNNQGPTTTDNIVRGNYIGLNASGSAVFANGQHGISISNAAGNIIGGPLAGQGNVIAGSTESGIEIRGQSATNNIVQGNRIGTDATGTIDLGNKLDGVTINNATGNVIGGDTAVEGAGAGNLISGNDRDGVRLWINASANVVQGNHIGTAANGSGPLANSGNGVHIVRASGNTIGGLSAGQGNVISGNLGAGIAIDDVAGSGDPANGNRIQGNWIGTDAAGAALGNRREGVLISASGTVVGAAVGESTGGNVIAHNGAAGVFAGVAVVVGSGGPVASGNVVRGNAIFDNTGLGIDLSPSASVDGVTDNDGGDLDAGANGLINFPVIAEAMPGDDGRIIGALSATPGAAYTLDFYANAAADPSGHGEGRRYLGSSAITVDGAGSASFDVTLVGSLVGAGEFITATATRDGEGTSEFSTAVSAAAMPAVSIVDVVETEGDAGLIQLAFAVSLSSEATSPVSVTVTTMDGTARTAAGDYLAAQQVITFNPGGPLTQMFVVDVSGDTTYETNEAFSVQLSNVTGAVIAGGVANGVINNDDAPPVIAIADAFAAEGNGTLLPITFVVTLSQASEVPASVLLNATPGTASHNDYSGGLNRLVTFEPGETSKNVALSISGDWTYEPAEIFLVNLSSPQQATIGDGQAVGTILESDAIPQIDALSADASVASPGQLVTLTAINARDTAGGVIRRVEFYRDWNSNGIIEHPGMDLLLASDTNGADGWSLQLGPGNQPLGTHQYLARVVDDGGDVSHVVSTTVTYMSLFAPTGILLSSEVVENRPPGQNPGLLRSTDPDGEQDRFVYTLVPGPGSDDNALFTIDGSSLFTTAIFDYETKSTYSIRVRSTDSSGQFVETAFTRSVVNDTLAPRVSRVLVSAGGWTQAFYDHLVAYQLGDASGYRVPMVDQLKPLPWLMDQIAVRFNEDVVIDASQLVLTGVNTPDFTAALAASAFSYDATTFTATWTLPAPLGADKLRLTLDDAVTDIEGYALDGEWIDTGSSQSGNGVPGGDFVFRFNVLPGDVDDSASVLGGDVILVRNSQFTTPGGGYHAARDINGSGAILGDDVILVRNRQFTSLPAGEPSPGALVTLATAPETTAAATLASSEVVSSLASGPVASTDSVRRSPAAPFASRHTLASMPPRFAAASLFDRTAPGSKWAPSAISAAVQRIFAAHTRVR